MEEIVDVVDEKLNIISRVPKAEAHKRGLLHKCVIAEIFDSKGNWTLVQQSAHKQDKGQYVSPVGGHVSAGESNEEALKREVFEEAGLKNFSFTYKGQVIFNRKLGNKIENHLFIVYEISSNEKLVLNEESVGYKRFSNDELKSLLKKSPNKFGDAFHIVIKTFYSELM
ncbi:MAG TPA: NUDIX domain-containing protein [Candidatus Nitrosocosmicus sp.]|nr:NUDIX domain-containing protein [Candidatus Nitrosocosmicus sp.]